MSSLSGGFWFFGSGHFFSFWGFFSGGFNGLFSILTLHLILVSRGNADEVGVGNAKGGGLGKDDEKVELLGHLGVCVGLWVTLSSKDGIVLVDENVVADDPNSGQGGGDDSEHASGVKFTSAGGGILSEEYNEEG